MCQRSGGRRRKRKPDRWPTPSPARMGQAHSPMASRPPQGAVTASEQIASYHDQADWPMADYLTALGWTQQPPPQP